MSLDADPASLIRPRRLTPSSAIPPVQLDVHNFRTSAVTSWATVGIDRGGSPRADGLDRLTDDDLGVFDALRHP
jgi:hypothetical protein